MIEIKSQLKGVTDREKWAARGASFMAKVKATKVVWFPPEPAKAGKKTTAAAKKSTKRVTKKTTSAAKKTSAGAAKAKSPARAKTA